MSAKQAKKLRKSMREHGVNIDATYYNPAQAVQKMKQTNSGLRPVATTTPVALNPGSGRALYKKVKNDFKRGKATLA